MENGLVWTECAVPYLEYAMGPEEDFLTRCAAKPKWSAADQKKVGQKVETYPTFYDFSIIIGSDRYATNLINMEQDGCCTYALTKNGKVMLTRKITFGVVDPNRNVWNIGGKLVWELADFPHPVIIVDGVDYNAAYQLEESSFPYEIKGKLIYIAKKNGKLHLVYDNTFIGPEFDEIQKPYCCGMTRLVYGSGQYWFVGTREGIKYLVSIQ